MVGQSFRPNRADVGIVKVVPIDIAEAHVAYQCLWCSATISLLVSKSERDIVGGTRDVMFISAFSGWRVEGTVPRRVFYDDCVAVTLDCGVD